MKPCTRHELELKLVCDSTEKMFFFSDFLYAKGQTCFCCIFWIINSILMLFLILMFWI